MVFCGDSCKELVALRKPGYLRKVFFDYPLFIWFRRRKPNPEEVNELFCYGVKLLQMTEIDDVKFHLTTFKEKKSCLILGEDDIEKGM